MQEAEFVRTSVRTLNRYFEKTIQDMAEGVGFTLPQVRVIREVVAHPGMRITDLAKALDATQSTVSDIVDRLAQAEILEKRPSGRDRRAVEVWPSPGVETFMRRDRAVFVNRSASELLEQLTPQERAQVVESLKLLLAVLERVRGSNA